MRKRNVAGWRAGLISRLRVASLFALGFLLPAGAAGETTPPPPSTDAYKPTDTYKSTSKPYVGTSKPYVGTSGSPSSTSASNATSAKAGGEGSLQAARTALQSKGLDPEKYISVKPDGSVSLEGNYMSQSLPGYEDAKSTLRSAGIDLAKVSVKDSLRNVSAADVARTTQEILRSRGIADPEKLVRVGANGALEYDRYNSLVSGVLGTAEAAMRFRTAVAPRFDPPPVAMNPIPPAVPGEVPAIVPPPAPGGISAPFGLKVDVVDGAARALVEKANGMNRSDNYSGAAPVYQQAIEKAKASGDLQAAAAAMVGLGMDQRKIDKRDESEGTYKTAIDLLQFMRASDDPAKQKTADRLLGMAEHGLAANDLVRGDAATALEHYRKSAEYYKEGGFDALVELSGDAPRIKQMEEKLKAAGKPIPKFEGIPDAKAYLAAVFGSESAAPPPATGQDPLAALVPPPATGAAGIPTALAGLYGFGVTKGGEGGKVITVTSLADSGPGSLRDALAKADAQGGNATIQFGVGGAINLKSTLNVQSPNVTIDGFSAPGNGITIHGDNVNQATIHVKTHDVIIQNLAVRNGYDLIRIQPATNGDKDSVHHIVLDHVSLTNSKDGAVDITQGAHDVTVQWSYIAGSGTPGQSGGGGASLVKYGTTNVSFLNNYFDKNLRRTMLADNAFVDFRNNIVKDWQQMGTQFVHGGSGNAVGNTYIMNPGAITGDNVSKSLYGYTSPGTVHFSDNAYIGTRPYATGQSTSSTPLSAPAVPTRSASDAAKWVLSYAGKFTGERDEVDLKYMSLPNYDALKAYKGN